MARQRQSGGGNDAALGTAFEFFNEIGIIAQLSSNQMERTMPHQLTQSQFSVLNWFVRVDAQATPGRLASAFQVTRGAMTNTLSKLEGKGFVKIEPHPTSGRSKRVTMTRAGRRARDDAIRAAHGPLTGFLDHFPPGVLKKALPLLRDIRSYLDEARG